MAMLMRRHGVPPLLVAGLVLPVFTAGDGTAGENRLMSAIQTRCVQECQWLRTFCSSGFTCRSDGDACMKRCADERLVARAQAQKPPDGWGLSKEQAIEVCLPAGERAFLGDLRCRGGAPPRFHRSGSVGSRNQQPAGTEVDLGRLMDPTAEAIPGQPDLHIVDRYEVVCPQQTVVLFLDMYHCATPKPWWAPRGFTRPLP